MPSFVLFYRVFKRVMDMANASSKTGVWVITVIVVLGLLGYGINDAMTKPYGIRKDEKQKLRYHYSVLERQFRRYMGEASRSRGNTGEALMQLLERRLDNTLRRAGLARTIWMARQFVAHGLVLVNGRKVDRPSYSVSPGEVITIKPKVHKVIRETMESLAGHAVPGWIEVNPAELTVRVLAVPTSHDIPFDVNTNLIIEFYR